MNNKDDNDLSLSDEYLEADSFASSLEVDMEIIGMRDAEDRHAVWLCDNGREDEPVGGGLPACFSKALYLDKA